MTAIEVSQAFVAQGADRNAIATMLEALHEAELLPTWGEGQTGADLSTREVVTVVLGATAPDPVTAAEHVIRTAGLIREDAKSLGEVLVKIMEAEPYTIAVDQLEVSDDGHAAVIRYPGGGCDVFYTNGGLAAIRQACIVRGSLLGAIAMKMHHPAVSGWSDPRPVES